MELHKNARTCPASRALLVRRVLEESWTVAAASAAAGCSERTGWKWVGRYREQGRGGLLDRPSAPRRVRRVGKTKRRLIVTLR
ncbi:MAG TPA: leucine zipper domain-containing protein, partial [Thermoanaerobaculia bacterium]|nr:leucine zipper domain-containing protein [Thermoanaerobaculia bacterium]